MRMPSDWIFFGVVALVLLFMFLVALGYLVAIGVFA